MNIIHGRHLARFEWVLITLGIICLILTLHPTISSDGEVRYRAVEALLGHHGKGGTIKIKYSLVQPVLSMPIAWIGDFLGVPSRSAVSYFNLIVFLSGSIYLYFLLARQYSAKVARLFLILLGCASMMPHHLQFYFSEVFTSMLLMIGMLCVHRRPVVASLVFALALANGPALIISFSVVALLYFLRTKCLSPAIGAALALALVLMDNQLKFGSFLGSPYLSAGDHGFKTILPYSGRPGFSYPLFFGILSITLSFGKGLVFYIPGILIFFNRSARNGLAGSSFEKWLVATFVVLVIATYAKWWAWYGGNFWGPRFFLFLCLPVSLLLALEVASPQSNFLYLFFTSGVLVLSVWVGVDGYLFGQEALNACWANNYALEMMCWYTPEFSALWHPFVTGDIGSAWRHPRAPFALWQCIAGGYLIIQLWMSRKEQSM